MIGNGFSSSLSVDLQAVRTLPPLGSARNP